MEDLNEIIISAIFNKLKINAIVAVSEEYSWADADPDGGSGGVDYHLELSQLKQKREKLVEEISRETLFDPSSKWYKYEKTSLEKAKRDLVECEKDTKESAKNFLGINSKNKTIEPISEKLDKNIKECLPEKVYNFLIAKCLEDENYKHILNLNALDLIFNYWQKMLPNDKEAWKGDGVSEYYWEVLFKENNKIERIYAGELEFPCEEDDIKYDFWKVFVENYEKIPPEIIKNRLLLTNI